MKKAYIIALLLFTVTGVFFADAQDLIVLKDGGVIEGLVTEVSETEIRYRRSDMLDGPVFVIPVERVLLIRFENGVVERFEITPLNMATTGITAFDPSRSIFSLAADPSGFLFNGPTVSVELLRGSFFSQLNTHFLSLGRNSELDGFAFGMGLSFNYFHHTRTGGFFLGGAGTFNTGSLANYDRWYGGFAGLNLGYIFVLPSWVFFRASASIGAVYYEEFNFSFKPDFSFGYAFGKGDYTRVPAGMQQPAQQAVTSEEESSGMVVRFSVGSMIYYILNGTTSVYQNNSAVPMIKWYWSRTTVFSPVFSLRFLFPVENNLQLGLGVDGMVSWGVLGIGSYDYWDDGMTGFLAPNLIFGMGFIYLSLGYDIGVGGLYVSPALALGDKIFLSFPMSLFGSNENFSIGRLAAPPIASWMPEGERRVYRYNQYGISIQYVFGGI